MAIMSMIGISFYGLTIWIVGIVVLFFLLLMGAMYLEEVLDRRRLRKMHEEADAKRGATTDNTDPVRPSFLK